MTKDEFLNMLQVELDNLEQEYRSASQITNYYMEVDSKSSKAKNAEHQRGIIAKKIEYVKRIITLPAYARIQAMSDAEIEEYKKEKIEELDVGAQEIIAKEAQEKEKFAQLKAERDLLILQLTSFSDKERNDAIHRAQELEAEISEYEDNLNGVFAKLAEQLKDIRKSQDATRQMTSQNIKNALSSNVKQPWASNYGYVLFGQPRDTSLLSKLEESVATDFEKTQQLLNLYNEYRILDPFSIGQWTCYNIKETLQRPLRERNLSKSLEKEMTTGEQNIHQSLTPKYVGTKLDELLSSVTKYSDKFEREKEKFIEQFTLPKLIGLYKGRDRSGVGENKFDSSSLAFLSLHTDKIIPEELNYLKTLVEQKNKLSKKIFKSTILKMYDIPYKENQINKIYGKLCNQIRTWYEYNSVNDVLNLTEPLNIGLWYTDVDCQRYLSQMNDKIQTTQAAISNCKKCIIESKGLVDQSDKDNKNKAATILQKVKEIGGEQFEQMSISDLAPAFNEYHEVVVPYVKAYEQELIDGVKKEAQSQADEREAELRNISINELRQMREHVTTDFSQKENDAMKASDVPVEDNPVIR